MVGAWGQRGDSQLWAREGCPGLAVSLGVRAGYQHLLGLSGPVFAIWDQSKILWTLNLSSVCPNIQVMRAKVMGKVKGRCLALPRRICYFELLLHGQALAREDGRKQD